jgi:hypothetical protein
MPRSLLYRRYFIPHQTDVDVLNYSGRRLHYAFATFFITLRLVNAHNELTMFEAHCRFESHAIRRKSQSSLLLQLQAMNFQRLDLLFALESDGNSTAERLPPSALH